MIGILINPYFTTSIGSIEDLTRVPEIRVPVSDNRFGKIFSYFNLSSDHLVMNTAKDGMKYYPVI